MEDIRTDGCPDVTQESDDDSDGGTDSHVGILEREEEPSLELGNLEDFEVLEAVINIFELVDQVYIYKFFIF